MTDQSAFADCILCRGVETPCPTYDRLLKTNTELVDEAARLRRVLEEIANTSYWHGARIVDLAREALKDQGNG